VKTRLSRWLRPWLERRVSLRVRITAAFTLVVVGGTAVSTLIGSRIITNALLEEARSRAAHGLDTGLTVYGEALESTRRAVEHVAESETLVGPASAAEAILEALRRREGLDFLVAVPAAGSFRPDACLADSSLEAMVRGALAGAHAAGADVLSRDCLLALDPALAERAQTAVDPSPSARDRAPAPLTSGLALVAAEPIADAGGVVGAVYGGLLLNRRSEIVDRVKLLVYGDDRYKGRPIGTASLLLGDVRVASNEESPEREGAIGTRASADVSEAVLTGGRPWHGRAFVFDDWYVGAYQPLRDYSGSVIGMLYVGMLEAPILAVRTDVMLTFLVVCVIGLLIVFGLTYLITRRTISPLEEMVAATKTIAAGDLSVRVSVASRDEIGDLAGSFNDMLSSLQATKSELEEWGRTLEQKVQERTDQLGAVQAQMVRSEKLASIGRLAAGVAHSINNPLGGILSLSMLALESCPDDAALRHDLDTIARQALRCREIVKGLLDFSHQSDARAIRTDANIIIDGAVQLLQRQAVFHNITIERRAQPGLPAVLVDPGQLQEVVTNLCVNAVDAMEAGGTLTVETASTATPPEVLIRVTDTGKGIPPDAMPYLFEPFFTTKTVGKGTGLGLAIVHGIITRAGGRVEVNSSAPGTTFTIHLPVAPAEAEEPAGLPSASVTGN
jgi:two-component system, NtrC family, sensor kinase